MHSVESAPKKQRVSFPEDEMSLQEQTTREIVRQYLEQRPGRLEDCLNLMPEDMRKAAIKRVVNKHCLCGDEFPESGAAPKLKLGDSIAVLASTGAEEAHDIRYGVVDFKELTWHVQTLVQLTLDRWCFENYTASSRHHNSEWDGSATVILSDENFFDDYINKYIQHRRRDHEREQELIPPEDRDAFDEDGLAETVRQEFGAFIDYVGVKGEDVERQRFTRTPTVTLRCSARIDA